MFRAVKSLLIVSSSSVFSRGITKFTMSSSSSGSIGIKIAVVQMCAVSDKLINLKSCERLVKEASEEGATLVCLPECCLYISGGLFAPRVSSTVDKGAVSVTETIEGPSMRTFQDIAKGFGVWLSVGSFPEVIAGSEKGHNLQVLISPAGIISHSYRKIHLFDSPFSGLQESKTTSPGDRLVVADLGFAKVGLSTCYDLRFPEMYSVLRDMGAEIILVPSAFTYKTGLAHWEVLLRSRAIETQSYIVAAAQAGKHNMKRESFGQSMIIDPWGKIISQCRAYNPDCSPSNMNAASDEDLIPIQSDSIEEICYATFDRQLLESIRESMPISSHKRRDLYFGPSGTKL